MADQGSSVWFKESQMLYDYVIDTVMTDCKELFLDEGVPEDVLLDLKAIWEQHVEESRVTTNQPSLNAKAHRNTSASNGARVAQMHSADVADEKGDGDADSRGQKYERPVNDTEEITSDDDEPGAEDAEGLMDTGNILVCQYDKVVRVKNKFRMQLKSGIMTVNEKDYVFQKCQGEADW